MKEKTVMQFIVGFGVLIIVVAGLAILYPQINQKLSFKELPESDFVLVRQGSAPVSIYKCDFDLCEISFDVVYVRSGGCQLGCSNFGVPKMDIILNSCGPEESNKVNTVIRTNSKTLDRGETGYLCEPNISPYVKATRQSYSVNYKEYRCKNPSCIIPTYKITVNSPQAYRVGEKIIFTAKADGTSSSDELKAKFYDKISTNTAALEDGIWLGDGNWKFVFNEQNLPSAGIYNLEVYYYVEGQKISETLRDVRIRSALGATITIDPVLFTTKEITMRLSVLPTDVTKTTKVLKAFIDKNEINMVGKYSITRTTGENTYLITIDKGAVSRTGKLDFIVDVSDDKGFYEPFKAVSISVDYRVPQVLVNLKFPEKVKVNDFVTFRIETFGAGSDKIDADYYEVKMILPNKDEKKWYKKDLTPIDMKNGVYELTYTFDRGQQHYISVIARKEGYDEGGSDSYNIAVEGGGTCLPSDPGCTITGGGEQVNLLYIMGGVGILIAIAVAFVIFGKKKGRK